MSRIKEAFSHGKAFIPFLTCGDPDLETTEAAIRAMEAAGADLIQLGGPASGPGGAGDAAPSAGRLSSPNPTGGNRVPPAPVA